MVVNTISSATNARAAGMAAARSMSCTQTCFQTGSSSAFGAAGSGRKAALMTLTVSPRSLLTPRPCSTRAVSFSSSSGVSGVDVVRPRASVVTRWFTTTAADRRLMLPVALRTVFCVRSTSKLVLASLRRVPAEEPAWVPCKGAAAPATGAVPGTGGWLVCAPGTPLGVLAPAWVDSRICVDFTAAGESPLFGLNSSLTDMVSVKSMSAVTVARKCSRPTTGSSNSTRRFCNEASTC